MKVEYEGKQYYAETESEQISCKGCAFNKQDVVDYDFCDCNDSDMINDCYNQQIVWKEVKAPMFKKIKDEEPKFTVREVLLAAGNHLRTHAVFSDYDKVIPEALEAITQDLMKQDDPDYLLYLQLKALYENKAW